MWNQQLIVCESTFFNWIFELVISHAKVCVYNEEKPVIIQIRFVLTPAGDYEPTFEPKWRKTYSHIFCKQPRRYRTSGRLLNVLCKFNLRPLSTAIDLRDCAQKISLFKIQKTDYDLIESSSIDIILICL